jgi:hypothetical protein
LIEARKARADNENVESPHFVHDSSDRPSWFSERVSFADGLLRGFIPRA